MGSIWPEAEPSDVLLLSGAELVRLLDRDALIAAMTGAMRSYSTGGAAVPLRTVMALPGERLRILASMPGYLSEGAGPVPSLHEQDGSEREPAAVAARVESREVLGAKLVSVYPDNTSRGLESHYGLVVLFDAETARPLAVMDGTFITTARTAAVSAVSVDLLARRDASVLAVIGSGVQARAHLWALAGIRPFREARVHSRDLTKARALADSAAPYLPFPVRAVEDAEQAVAGAEVVVTATNSATPVLHRSWLSPGVHVVAVGSSTPGARELDSESVRDALVVVDSRTGALAEAGDILIPLKEGVITADHVYAELGELLADRKPGRTSADQITLYKSLGLAVQDLAAARLALDRATAMGAGTRVKL